MIHRLKLLSLLSLAYFACFSSAAEKINLIKNPTLEKRYAARAMSLADFPDKRVRQAHRKLPGFTAEPELPYGWIILAENNGKGLISWEKAADCEQVRIKLESGEKLTICQKYIELVPKVDYIATLKISGKGDFQFRIVVSGAFPTKRILNQKISATEKPSTFEFPLKTNSYPQLAQIELIFSKPCDIRVGEVGLWTEGNPDKTVKAESILFQQSFEKPLNDVNGKPVKIVENGYSGKGVEVSSKGGGTVLPLSGFELPEEGTIEFWYKASDYPSEVSSFNPLVISTNTPGLSHANIHFQFKRWLEIIAFGVKKGKYAVDQAYNQNGIGWGWWQPGTWHHIAGSWDKEALRLYVDGSLEGIISKPGIKLPDGKVLDMILKGPGVIDEIVISKGLKYGPTVPKEAKKVAWNRKNSIKKVTVRNAETLEITNAEINKKRKENTKPVPKLEAEYVFGVDKAKPSWEGMEGYKLKKDFYAKGKHKLTVKPRPTGNSAYWKLEGIETGKYYVGFLVESQYNGKTMKTEYSPENLALMAYLNGWPLRFETSSDPVQVKPGIWLCELQSKEAVEFKNGDEIAFAPAKCWLAGERPVCELVLRKKEPIRGHGVTGQTWGTDHGTLPRQRVLLFPSLTGSGKDGEAIKAKVLVTNPLACEVDVCVTWNMFNYFGDPIWSGDEKIKLAPHEIKEFTYDFKAKGSDKGYFIDVKSKPSTGYQHPFPRPEEWLEFNDYTKMRFRPDLSGPLTAWNQSRFMIDTITTGLRQQDIIDGKNWEQAWFTSRLVPKTVPKDLEFRKIPNPYKTFKLPENCFGTWNKKLFVIPKHMKGQRILLRMRAETEATVFVNGKCFGERIGQFIPMIFDVTSAIKDEGENELVICIRDAIGLVRDDFADKYSRDNMVAIKGNLNRTERWIKPGKVKLRQIELLGEPKVGVRQALVLSDLGKKLLKIMLKVRNSTPKPQEVKISLSVDQNGKNTETKIPEITLNLKPWETVETSVEAYGGNLIPYEPGNPVFSTLNVNVKDAKNGEIRDKFRQRFGYRSYFVDGLAMNYNGKPARFFGASRYPARSFFERESDIVLERISYDESRLNELDEWGQLHYEWVGVPFPKGWKVLNNDRYWKDYQDLAIEFLWRYGSHPCFVGLNISNESYHYASSAVGAEGQKQHAEKIYSIAEAVRKAFDWDFWFMADGDADLDGKLNFFSFHYLNQQGSYSYKPGTLGMYADGIYPYAPDSWFLNGAAKVPEKGSVILPHFKYGSKACAATEEYWFMVNGPPRSGRGGNNLGDRMAVSSAWQFYTLRGRSWCWQSYEGYRDMEMAMINGRTESFFGSFQKYVWFSMPEQEVRYYGGHEFDRRINLHDDEGKSGKILFDWSLESPEGEIVASGKIEEESGSTWIKRDRIKFRVPEVKKRSEFKLKMKIAKNGKCYKDEIRIIDVWPEPDFPLIKQDDNADSTQVIYDPKGLISPILKKIGWKARKIDKLDSESLEDAKRLVIGPECVAKGMSNLQPILLSFIEKGGRILLLKQSNASILPVKTVIDKRGWISKAFVRAPEHPVMKGLTDRDFTMWQPKHLLAEGLYNKPTAGNVLPLLDAGFALSMNWTPLLELYAGKGSIIACQLMLAEAFEEEPMSAEMIKRILNYMEEPVYKHMNSDLFVLNPVSEKVIQCLNELRTEYKIINKIPAPLENSNGNQRSIVFIDLTVKDNDFDRKALRAFVESGGTVMFHRATPKDEKSLSNLTGQPVKIEVQPYKSWADRQMLERRDGLLEGLNNIDLYWRTVIKDCSALGRNQVSIAPPKELGQVQFLVKTAASSEYLFPGGFATLDLGKGEIVFDQLAWEIPDEKNIYYTYGVLPSRTISTILSNLGVVQAPPAPPIKLPKGVEYQTIDISGVANRALKDDKAGDGIGWKDWGSSADLRTFPTGQSSFNGVPFNVPKGDKNAIVLPAAKRILPNMPKFPDRIVIPVNKSKVAGLWFLQTGGWTASSAPYAHREIIYTDGSKELIQLNGLNFADWNCGRDKFPDERGTRTMVAWKGTTETWPMVRVYQQLWLNPHPEKEIKEVVLSVEGQPEKNRRFVAHLGLTAAILDESKPKTEKDNERDTAKSQELVQKARELQLTGKEKEALPLLKEALKADKRNLNAWSLLAEIQKKSVTVADFESLCHEWVKAVPTSPKAWNTLGRYYESKKMIPKAIKAYRRSLEIDSISQLDIFSKLEALEKK